MFNFLKPKTVYVDPDVAAAVKDIEAEIKTYRELAAYESRIQCPDYMSTIGIIVGLNKSLEILSKSIKE